MLSASVGGGVMRSADGGDRWQLIAVAHAIMNTPLNWRVRAVLGTEFTFHELRGLVRDQQNPLGFGQYGIEDRAFPLRASALRVTSELREVSLLDVDSRSVSWL